jgi:hypothetical protein
LSGSLVGDGHIGQLAQIAADLAQACAVPAAGLLVVLLVIVMGSISPLFGYHTRHAAMMLFGMTMIAAATMHVLALSGAASARPVRDLRARLCHQWRLAADGGLGPGRSR